MTASALGVAPLADAVAALARLTILDEDRLQAPDGVRTAAQLAHDPDDELWHSAPAVRLAARVLYAEWYAGIAPQPANAHGDQPAWETPRPRPSHGWRVLDRVPNGAAIATRGTTTVCAAPGTFLGDEGPGEIREGQRIILMTGGSSQKMQPGWVHRFGEQLADGVIGRSTVRVYFNLAPRAAGTFLRECAIFDRRRIPYQAKVSSELVRYRRRDAAVVYLPARYLPVAAEAIVGLHEALRPELSAPVPPLTRAVAPGLAAAESPPDGESFGVSRCRTLATVLHERSDEPTERGLAAAVSNAFEAAGMDPRRPHLNTGKDPQGIEEGIDLLEAQLAAGGL